VQVQGAYYSVPPEHLGREVWARWDGRLVRLFDRRMQPIAVHAQQSPGRFAATTLRSLPHHTVGLVPHVEWNATAFQHVDCESIQLRVLKGTRFVRDPVSCALVQRSMH